MGKQSRGEKNRFGFAWGCKARKEPCEGERIKMKEARGEGIKNESEGMGSKWKRGGFSKVAVVMTRFEQKL